MIDYFALALPHFLIVVALIRMLGRDELDHEEAIHAPKPPAIERPAEGRGS